MDKIMKLAALMREAKSLVDEINKDGEYNILTAGVDMDITDALVEKKQAYIYFYNDMPDMGGNIVKTLMSTNYDGEATYKHSVTVDGVKFYYLEKEENDNAKVAV